MVKIQTIMQSHIYLFLQSQVNMLDFEQFKTYLRVTHSKNKDTTDAIVRDVRMYLDKTTTTDLESDYTKLLDIRKVENFVEAISLEYKPTTRAEKLRRIKLAIKYIIRQNDDNDLYYRGKRTVDNIDEMCHGLAKQIAIQRHEYALVMRKQLPQIIDPNEFLENDQV